MIDIDASILPGISAAGFSLGSGFEEILADLPNPLRWNRSLGLSLSNCVADCPGWVSASLNEITSGGRSGEALYFGNGKVAMSFNAAGILYNISVFEGYRGLLWGAIKVGDPLSKVLETCGLFYDAGDEMHYPTGEQVNGLAFIAEADPIEDLPDQRIDGISVHDWKLQT